MAKSDWRGARLFAAFRKKVGVKAEPAAIKVPLNALPGARNRPVQA
jgi:hypothetical protein